MALTVRGGCPYLDDYDGNVIDSVATAGPALADSNPVCNSSREPMLKELDALATIREGCCMMLELLQRGAQ